MNNRKRDVARIAFATICIVGVFLAGLGLGSYIIRYGQLDALEGTIPDSVYLQVTGMFGTEKILILAGGVAAVVGGVCLVVKAVRAGRSASRS